MVSEDDTTHAFLGWLSEYTRNAENAQVELAERGATKWGRENINEEMIVSRQDVISVMKSLDELKLGRFIVGRRGAESRFEFWTSRVQIGQAAMGQIDRIDIDEEIVELEEEDVIEAHRMLIANALGKPISAVRIKIKE
ncbi:hypothetical protein [Allosediminivita pacifica]|uniref:Uncharacterized protein n=1 Tax=Allosediminivita pacifica TaxID=1267769 RepID=A0A2T5ZV69_9RHOB|nr:hypothetical protein [Allosediminivita pacifica]PTX35453.1 hypothetical protein C8N44_1802 [Allosediminivita pacifica]